MNCLNVFMELIILSRYETDFRNSVCNILLLVLVRKKEVYDSINIMFFFEKSFQKPIFEK